MNEDRDKSFRLKFPYRCKHCGTEFWMSYYDIMRLTDGPLMPCGCEWTHLGYRLAVSRREFEQHQEDSDE